jgi:electron transport complex protein RnfA
MNWYVETILFYSFSCSAVLLYGIGLEKSIFESRPGAHFFRQFPGLIIETLVSTILIWYLDRTILLPFDVPFLVPMTIILVCGIVHTIAAVFIPSARNPASGERIFFFGTVFLATNEASSFVESLLIVGSCILSFYLTTIMLNAVRERMSTSRIQADWRGTPLVLVSMGLLCMVLYAGDVSWWFTEVFIK